MDEYFIKDIVYKDMVNEKDKSTLQKKYRSLFNKKKNKKICCIKRLYNPPV